MTPPEVEYRIIPLTQGQVAYVSPRVYEDVSKFKWMAFWNKLGKCFYASRLVTVAPGKRNHLFMHRQILGLSPSDPRTVDHRNKERTLDNTDENLRIADRAQQAQNRGRRIDNTSGYKWVHKVERGGIVKWNGEVTFRGKRYHCGQFTTPEEAYKASLRKAEELHGEFVCGA